MGVLDAEYSRGSAGAAAQTRADIQNVGLGFAGAFASFGSAYAQSKAIEDQAAFQKMQYESNQRLSKILGDDAIKRGDLSANAVKQKGKEIIGSQRAGMAAQGIDVNTGSAMQIQQDTAEMAQRDANTLKNNAWREAWGYRVQANQHGGTAGMIQLAGDSASRNTILTGGLNALNYAASGFSKKGK